MQDYIISTEGVMQECVDIKGVFKDYVRNKKGVIKNYVNTKTRGYYFFVWFWSDGSFL